MAQNQELIKYIKEQLAKGKTRDEVRLKLRQTGWLPLDIDVAFYAVQGNTILTSPSLTEANKKVAKKKGGASGFLYFLLIVAILAFMGASVMAYLRMQNPEPKVVFSQMLLNIAQNKSFSYAGSLQVGSETSQILTSTASGEYTDVVSIVNLGSAQGIDFQGSYSILNEQNPLFSITTQAKKADGSSIFALEARSFKDKTYVLIDSKNKSETYDLALIKDTWILLGPLALSAQPKESLTIEQKVQIVALISQSNAITLYPLESEIVSGVSTYHYRYTIDQNELIALFTQVNAILNKDNPLTDEQKKALQDIPQQTTFGGEVWIGKTNKQLYKMTLQIIGKLNATAEKESSTLVNLQFGRYGEEILLDEPKDTISVAEAFLKIMGLQTTPTPTPSVTVTPTVSISVTPTVSTGAIPTVTPSVTVTPTVPFGTL